MSRITAKDVKAYFRLSEKEYKIEKAFITSILNASDCDGTRSLNFNTFLDHLWGRKFWKSYKTRYEGDQAFQHNRDVKAHLHRFVGDCCDVLRARKRKYGAGARTADSDDDGALSTKRSRTVNAVDNTAVPVKEKYIQFVYVFPERFDGQGQRTWSQDVYPWNHESNLTGMGTVSRFDLEEVHRVAKEQGDSTREIRAMYGSLLTVPSTANPAPRNVVNLHNDVSVHTFFSSSGYSPIIIQVIYYRTPDDTVASARQAQGIARNTPCRDTRPPIDASRWQIPGTVIVEPDSSDPETQRVKKFFHPPRTATGFGKKVRHFHKKAKKYGRVNQLLRNNAAKQGLFNSLCFPGEACFDPSMAMPIHAQAREKTAWVAQGSSNSNYRTWRQANPLQEADIAADTNAGYTWSYDFTRRSPTPDAPNVNDCKS